MEKRVKAPIIEDNYREKYAHLVKDYEEVLTLYNILDQIIENSADAIWISDADGNCLRVNHAYEELIGMSRNELIGRSAQSLVGSVVSEICSTNVLKTGKPYSFEQKFYLTSRTALVTGTPVFDSDGQISLIICNDRDMNALGELREQLQQTQKLANYYHREIEKMKEQLTIKSNIAVGDAKMIDLLHMVNRVAKMDSSVLILGETGVGKGEIAKYIHENSMRANEPFVKIDCGAITLDLIESELFGYEKGAFTGADRNGKMGLFEFADGGTAFLDEIGELPLHIQSKLLQVLQEGSFRRVGSTTDTQVNVRIIAATNQNLKEMVEKKTFRADLYYRINIFPIEIPPLHERKDDILPMAKMFLQRLNEKYHSCKFLEFDALSLLRHYKWPGNVRELKNAIEQAYIICEGDAIRAKHFSFYMQDSVVKAEYRVLSREGGKPLSEILEHIEYEYIVDAYSIYKNVREAASFLQMSPATFVRKRKQYEEKYGVLAK